MTKFGSVLKWLLHTRLGPFIGFYLGISGYNRVFVVIKRANGQIKSLRPSYNARVNKGAALTASLLSGSSLGGISSPLAPKYIALSTSTLTIASTDTTLTGETSATGLGRTAGTVGGYVAPTTLDGGASYTVSNTFTNSSAGVVSIKSVALFDAVAVGNMFVEANLSFTAIMNPSDQIIVTWTSNV